MIRQPAVFAVKLLTNLCLIGQLTHLIPEEMGAFFDGTLSFPEEDELADEIDRLDAVLAQLPPLSDDNTFLA